MKTSYLTKLWRRFKSNWQDFVAPLVFFILISFLFVKNYASGTFLTGWDNLHPEFNFKLNIIRSLNAAWQEYQGVGLLGGMAHAAALPREIILSLVSTVIPVSFIRYFWTFLMLLLGPVGVYFLLRLKTSKIASFGGSLFYLFNLATVQYFFVPFEAFVSFFGFLPWLIFGVENYFKVGNLKSLFIYFLISLLAISAFYVQTLFVVYVIILTFYLLKKPKKAFMIVFVTFLANAFWLLPVAWFGITSGLIPGNSEINRIATPETALMNQAKGDFQSVVSLKGYWFDYFDWQQTNEDLKRTGKFEYLFKDWIDWTNKPYMVEIGIAIFGMSLIGFLISGNFIGLILILISYVMLAGNNAPTNVIYNFLIEKIPLFAEAFRSNFTKWSVAFAFFLSLGLGYFVDKFKKLSIIPFAVIGVISIYSVFPVFNGKLISERVKVSIPHEYFEVFNWFNNSTNGERVAFLPYFDKWGWNYHVWGHGGSGFIWYGIKNPILDRAFNVWSPYNEGFYKEITTAINNGDNKVFASVLSKYQVKYLLLDRSIETPWGDSKTLKIDEIESFVNSLGYMKRFESGFISIFDTGLESHKFISALNRYSSFNVNLKYSLTDPLYNNLGSYVNLEEGKGYPFINFDTRGPVDIKASESGELVFENKNTNSKVLVNPINKTVESFSSDRGYPNAENCELNKKGRVEREDLDLGRRYKASESAASCDYFVYELLENSAYVLRVKGENLEGRSLKIYLYSWKQQRVVLEELLPTGKFDKYFVVYPTIFDRVDNANLKSSSSNKNQIDTGGFTLNLETRSFGRVTSENKVEVIELIPFDIDFISNLYIDALKNDENDYSLEISDVQKWGTAIYRVSSKGKGIINLGQGYEDGWIGFKIVNNRPLFLNHFKVNSWSNGFEVYEDGVYYLVFWPQFLEWGGMFIVIITLFVLSFKTFSQQKRVLERVHLQTLKL